MDNDIEKIFFSKKQINKRTKEIAKQLDKKFKGTNPLAIGVLKGSALFFADLLKEMKTNIEMDFMALSSYGFGTKSSGKVQIVSDLNISVSGRDIIVVEDIIDSGNTLNFLKNLLLERGAKTITIVTLLDKPSRREVNIKPDYFCFEVGNEFVVGYGLDYNNLYRNLPYVGILKKDIYKK